MERSVWRVMACHMEGLRALAHIILFCIKTRSHTVIDVAAVRHALGAFLIVLSRLVQWIEDSKHRDDRLAPIMPMET
jgi:hypothetical protein